MHATIQAHSALRTVEMGRVAGNEQAPLSIVGRHHVVELPWADFLDGEVNSTQAVFNIVCQNPEGINSKEIGLAAGQEEAKAAAWATGGLKKLVEENLVVREQLAGNKVIYKAA